MDRKNQRTEFIEKKNDIKKRDRGDLKLPLKFNEDRLKRNEIVNPKIINPSGDTRKVITNQSPEFKIDVTIKQATCHTNNDKFKSSNEREKSVTSKPNIVKDIQNQKTALNLKRIREKYTIKLRNSTRSESPLKKCNIPVDKVKTEIIKTPFDDLKNESIELPQHYLSHTGQNALQKHQRQKPVIKTITTKNGPTRIYKAVTFEKKKIKPATLDIKIPNDTFNKDNSAKSSDVNSMKSKQTVSKVSIKEKFILTKKFAKKCDRKYTKPALRDLSVRDSHRSPPTEVAKWAPASITTDTKPYYEAWVDTTLTAIPKADRLKFEKKAIMRYLQKALERPDTPELYYSNFSDERYTGKIKIRHQK